MLIIGLEPILLTKTNFKSAVSTIPPNKHVELYKKVIKCLVFSLFYINLYLSLTLSLYSLF